MNKVSTVIVIVVAFFIGVYLVDAVITKEQVRDIKNKVNSSSEPIISRADARTEFMSTCDDGTLDGANFDQTRYCECTFNEIVDEVGVNKLVNIGLNYTDSQLDDFMQPYATTCLRKQGIEI